MIKTRRERHDIHTVDRGDRHNGYDSHMALQLRKVKEREQPRQRPHGAANDT